MPDPTFQQAAQDLAALGRVLHARGWVPATSGNFSLRLADGDIAITASGRDKSRLEGGDILRLAPDGRPRMPGTPSAETGLHLQLYARDPGIGAVLHTHSLNAVLAGRRDTDAMILSGLELLKAFPGIVDHRGRLTIPVFDNDQDIAALAARVEAHMARHGVGHAYLIRGHGVYAWGPDAHACLLRLEALEYLFEYDFRTRQAIETGGERHE